MLPMFPVGFLLQFTFTFSHLADAVIDLQIRKSNKS